MSILTVPPRLSKMMIDCHPSIVAGYHYTQGALDQIERPCFLIFVEDASYPQTTEGQEQVEQSYSLAYVGEAYNVDDEGVEYEIQARTVAEASVLYLFEHPQLTFENRRSISIAGDTPEETFDGPEGMLDGVTGIRLESRSAVTLFSRDGVNEAFWGFSIEITIKEQLSYETVGY